MEIYEIQIPRVLRLQFEIVHVRNDKAKTKYYSVQVVQKVSFPAVKMQQHENQQEIFYMDA